MAKRTTEKAGTAGDKHEPHAYVSFALAGTRATVPLTFIQAFPSKWSDEGWNKNKLYKTFWSPNGKETPSSVLKEVADIPTFDQRAPMTDRGYYRASVIAVEKSLLKLQDCINTKRLPVKNMKYQDCSFDESSSKKEASNRHDTSSKNTKDTLPTSTEKAERTKQQLSKKKGGINLVAQSLNTEDIRKDIEKLFLPDTKKNSEVIEPTTEPATQKEMSTSSSSRRRNSGVNNTKKNPDSDDEDDTSDTSSDEDSSKFDPDFTPQKYEALKEDYKIVKNNYERVRNLNLRYQENFFEWDAERKMLQDENAFLEKENASLKSALKRPQSPSPESVSSEKSKFVNTEKPAAVQNHSLLKHGTTSNSPDKSRPTEAQSSEDEDLSMPTFVEDEHAPPKAQKRSHSKDDDGALPLSSVKRPRLDVDDSGDNNDPPRLNTAALGDKDDSLAGDTKSTGDAKEDDDSFLVPKAIKMPNAEVKSLIEGIKAGKSRDLRFVKDLAIVAFGPEVLASSSIFGTNKGGNRKKDDAPKMKKPRLDSEILESVREALIQRVMKEEGLSQDTAFDTHERTKLARFHDAIRGAMKRCRSQGYGVGEKSNEVALDLLRE